MSNVRNTSNDEMPLYNIRILRSYIKHVQNNYSGVDIDKILNYAGVSRLQFNDHGYWCSQSQMNKLQKILIAETGNKNIARDTGRSLMVSQNIIAFYVLSFSNIGNVIRQIAKIYNKLSRAATIEIINLGSNLCELVAVTAPGVKEEPYQCKNRIGSFEGILKLFLNQYPIIEHPECYHQGAKRCKYIITWNKPSGTFKWLRIRNYSIFTGVIISLLILSFFPLNYFLISSLISLTLISILSYHVQTLEKDKLTKNVDELGRTAEELLDELNLRYNVTKLVQEVGEITSVIQNEKEMASAVSKAMSRYLAYDRGAILLAGNNKKNLHFAGGYGFTEAEIALMSVERFSLYDPVTDSIFQKVFEKQEPSLIVDMDKIVSSMNPEVARNLKIKSLICVPILHEGKSLGVMLVDSLKSRREFSEGDINLLMAVAAQTALSVAHARAFQKLQESEKKHRTLVETIRDIVYTVDLGGRFTYVSPMIEVITGYGESELSGRPFIDIVSPQFKDIVLQRFAEGLKTGGTSTYQIEILAKDGTTIPIELNVAPLTDTTGQPIGRIGVARDITRRYEEEAKRKEMEMKALTQDKLASLGEIATGIAHEINQPLSYIKIILQSTLHDLVNEQLDTEELTEDFQESLRQVGKITSIISHLRTFGRSDVTSFGPVGLSAVFNDTLILMKERLRIKNISMGINISENFPMLHGNHIKLEQVFLNLIQNSMDALEGQGKGEINLSAQVANNHALIRFSDTGAGVDAELQEKVFEPFFTTKEADKGTGIGLSIVYGIIQEHHGTIALESEGENGATFILKLPIFKDEGGNFLTESLNA